MTWTDNRCGFCGEGTDDDGDCGFCVNCGCELCTHGDADDCSEAIAFAELPVPAQDALARLRAETARLREALESAEGLLARPMIGRIDWGSEDPLPIGTIESHSRAQAEENHRLRKALGELAPLAEECARKFETQTEDVGHGWDDVIPATFESADRARRALAPDAGEGGAA